MNPRKLLYIAYVPLLLIEWTVDLLAKMWQVFHESIKTLTLVTESYINEPDQPKT